MITTTPAGSADLTGPVGPNDVTEIRDLRDALDRVIAPIVLDPDAGARAPSLSQAQEETHLASDPGFDIRTLFPAPMNTPVDAGPYFYLGLLHGTDPETDHSDVTIHRICVQGRDELSIFFTLGHHIDTFRAKIGATGRPLPTTINMRLGPAIAVGACFEAPTTPFGYDELQIASGLHRRAVEFVRARTIEQRSLARAEVVVEGELLPDRRVAEDQDTDTDTGHAMPEFPGYDGPANQVLSVMRVAAVTARHDSILHTLVRSGEEYMSLVGIPTEASLLHVLFSHVLDPSQQPAYDPRLSVKGTTAKTIYDAIYPWVTHAEFERAQFFDVDPGPWLAAAAACTVEDR